MNPWGGMLGNIGSAEALWQQQRMQQAFLGVTAGTNTNVGNTYVVSMAPVEAVPVKPKGPETALEWLDRRVNEMRLPLAA